MSKGNPSPTNNLRLAMTSELMDFIDSLPNLKGIPKEFLVARDFIKSHKEGFIKMHGLEVYQEQIQRYSRNRTEMRLEKFKRDKEIEKKRKERIKRKERELKIKEKELDIREANSGLREEKEKKKELEQLQDNLLDVESQIRNFQKIRRVHKLTENEAQQLSNLEANRDLIKMKIQELGESKE